MPPNKALQPTPQPPKRLGFLSRLAPSARLSLDVGRHEEGAVKATVLLVWGFVLFVAGGPAGGQESLFRLRSRDVGIQAFDLTVTETKRTPRTSVLNVPGFHECSAAGSRWLMCAFTDLAIRRGFDYWAVVYPEPPGQEELTRFRGHPMVGAERSVHDAEESSAVSPGVPAADC